MKLRFFIKNNEKIYTLKENENTKPAHYKFLKVRDAPKSNNKIISKK